MNNVSYGQSFNRNVDADLHYQILDNYENGKGKAISWSIVIFIASLIAFHEYPTMLISLDFGFTALIGLYLVVVKPLMLQGIIPAYYRKDYGNTKKLFYLINIIVRGSVIRFITVALYYITTLYLFVDRPSFEDFKLTMLGSIQEGSSWVIAIIVAGFIIYTLFYHEKYVTIQEFNNRVSEIITNTHYNLRGAVHEFVEIKDRELAMQKPKESVVSFHQEELKQTEIIEPVHMDEVEKQSSLIRRRARR